MTVYVQRDDGGTIVGSFNWPQAGFAEEAMNESSPEYIAFLENPTPQDKFNPTFDMGESMYTILTG